MSDLTSFVLRAISSGEKVKLEWDFLPEFTNDLETNPPTFNSMRVLNFVELLYKQVLIKILLNIYKPYIDKHESNLKDAIDKAYAALPQQNLTNQDIDKWFVAIHNDLRPFLQRVDSYRQKAMLGLARRGAHLSIDEPALKKFIADNADFAKEFKLDPEIAIYLLKENNVTRLRFEELSPSDLYAESQMMVNGDKRLPKVQAK